MSDSYSLISPEARERLYPSEGTILRNMAAGAVQVPRFVMSLVGAGDAASRLGERVNTFLGTTDAGLEDPASFAAQTFGGAMVGVPARVVSMLGRVPALSSFAARFPRATRIAEALTPVTLPLSPGNVALNTAGGLVVGTGAQLADQALRSNATRPLYDVTPSDAAPEQALVDITPSDVQSTTPQQNAAPQQGLTDITPVEDYTLGDYVANALPYALLGGASALAVRQAWRQHAARQANTAALRDTVVQPGAPADPTVVRTPLTQEFVRQTVDEGARVHALIDDAARRGQIDPGQQANLHAQVDLNVNTSALGEQAAAVRQTGVYPSGIRIGRSLDEIAREVATAPDQTAWARAQEYIALNNELSNRIRAAQEFLSTRDPQYLARDRNPATGSPNYVHVPIVDRNGVMRTHYMEEPARVGLWDMDFNTLQSRVAQLSTDPDAVRYGQEFQQRAEQWRRIAVAEGVLTQEEANRLARANPWYLPTLEDDSGPMTHLQRRPITDRSQPASAQDVIQSWTDYELNMVHAMQMNRARREVAQFLQDYQQRLPPNQRIVGEAVPQGSNRSAESAPDSINYRDQGKRMRLDVFSPGIASVMRNDPKFVVPIFNATRKAFQMSTTGPAAAAVGAPFAATSALYNTFSTLVTRPAGYSAGVLDRLAQDATQALVGRRIGLRPDPTFVLQSLYAPLADATSIAAREIAARLRNGPYAPVAQYLSRAYERSVHAEMQRYGATNTGIAAVSDFANRLPTSVSHVNALYDATRGVAQNMPQSLTELAQYAHRFGVTTLPHQAVEAWHLWREVIDMVSNAPQSALWRQNRARVVATNRARYGTDERASLEGLARVVRQAGADPSISGASRGWTGLLSMIPYGNLAIQSMSVYARALKNNPVGTIAAIAGLTVIPQLISAYTAMMYDEERMRRGLPPEAVRDRVLGSVNAGATGVSFYVPGLPVEAAFRLQPDPTLAPISAAVGMTVNSLLGLQNVDYFYSEDGQLARDTLRRLIRDREGRVLWEATGRAGAAVATPPLLDALLRAHNVDARDLLNIAEPRVGDLRRRTYPGYEEGRVAGDVFRPQVRHVVESLFGAAGVAATQHIQTMANLMRIDAPTDQQIATAFGMTAQRSADRMPLLNPLWSGPRRREAFDSAAEFVRAAEANITRIVQGSGDITRPGTIGSDVNVRVPEYGPGRVRPPEDIIPVIQAVQRLDRNINQLRSARAAVQSEVRSAQSVAPRSGPVSQGQYELLTDPRRMREFENRMNDRVREINSQIAALIVSVEQTLSEQTGRRIRINEIDPTRGLEQFSPLSQ